MIAVIFLGIQSTYIRKWIRIGQKMSENNTKKVQKYQKIFQKLLFVSDLQNSIFLDILVTFDFHVNFPKCLKQ